MKFLAEDQPHSSGIQYGERPGILNLLATTDKNNLQVRDLLNSLFIAMVLKMKFDNGSPYEPGTCTRKLRTLFAVFKKEGIAWGYKDFKTFPGCVDAVIAQEWQEYADANPQFGTKKNRVQFVETDAAKIRAFVTSPTFVRLQWLEHLCQFSAGCFFGFRGVMEHKSMEWAHIEFGKYPMDDPYYGWDYIKITAGILTKNDRITIGKSFARRVSVETVELSFKTRRQSFFN